jgi:hypothetical protein
VARAVGEIVDAGRSKTNGGEHDARVAWIAVSAAFGALGRVFVCLDKGERRG